MSIDVNKPVENPKLSSLLKELRNSEADLQQDLHEKIAEEIAMNAYLLAMVNMDEDKIEKKDDNTVVFKKDAQISFVMLKDQNENDYLAVYTDWDEIGKNEEFKNIKVNTFILSFDDMVAITNGKAGIVINPFSDNYVISNENVVHMKKHKDNLIKGYSENVVEKDTQVKIGDPANYPIEMVEAIKAYSKTNKNVNAIWLKLMIKDYEQSYLLIVDFNGDREKVFSSIASVATPYIQGGLPIDMVSYSDSFGKEAAIGEPFYKRKKGLFW